MSKLKSARAAKAQSHSVPKPVAMALARAKAGNATLEDIMLALKSFRTAAVTFSGIELAHRDIMQLGSCLLLASILRTGGRRYVASPPSGCDSRFLEPFWGLVLAAGTENHSSN